MRGRLWAISTGAALLAVAFLFLPPTVRAQSSSASPGIPCEEALAPPCNDAEIDFGVTLQDGGSPGTFPSPLNTQYVFNHNIVFGSACFFGSSKPPTVLINDGACSPYARSSGSPAFKTDWWCQFSEALASNTPKVPSAMGVIWFSAEVCYIDGPPLTTLMIGYDVNGVAITSAKSVAGGGPAQVLTLNAPSNKYICQVRVLSSADPWGLSVDCLKYPRPVKLLLPGYIIINKDFKNTTGQAVNDLHIVVKGKRTIYDYYQWPFTQFSYVKDVPPNQTTLEWSGATIPANGIGHVGWIQLWNSFKIVDMYWTLDGHRVVTNRAYQLSMHIYPKKVVLSNELAPEGIPVPLMIVRDLQIAKLGRYVPLDSLNAENAELQAAFQPLRDSVALPYDVPVAVPFPLPVGKVAEGEWIVLKMTITDPASSAEIVDYVEAAPEATPDIPTLSEWGAIIFGTLLFASVVFYIWRRRRAVAA